MFNKIFYTLLCLGSFSFLAAQVAIGTTTLSSANVSLELSSTDKALLIPRVANTSAIATPENGMLVYDLSKNCIKSYQADAWKSNCLIGSASNPSTSNGSAFISSIDNCSAASSGSLTKGGNIQPGNVTQSISVSVSTAGTYLITAEANGVLFKGDGTLAVGSQLIVLTAEGSPTTSGTSTFVLNTTPSCSFNRTVN